MGAFKVGGNYKKTKNIFFKHRSHKDKAIMELKKLSEQRKKEEFDTM